MGMDNNQVIRLLTDFRSYQYAANNCGTSNDYTPAYKINRLRQNDQWDRNRYNHIVRMIKGAVDEVLSDELRTVINRKYLDRNTMNLSQIATQMNVDPSTVSRWHRDAIRRLSIALIPLCEEEMEINNIDHMFDPNWRYQEPAS